MRRPRYPGPLLAKLTQWLLRWHEVRNTRQKFIESLHRKYGAFVQIAPKQISVNSADGLRDIFSVSGRLDRPGPLPLLHLYHSENLVSTECGQLHHERRKPLRSIYTARAVEGEHMQGVFKTVLGRLIHYVDEQGGEERPLDVIGLARLYTADIGSNIVYGSENSLNVLGDESQRIEFQGDLKWTENRLVTLWLLLMLWYPSFAQRLQQIGLAPGRMPGGVPEDLMMNRKGRELLTRLLSGAIKSPHGQPETLMETLVSEYMEHGSTKAMPGTEYILSDTLDHFWAGIGTTSDALAAVFYQLSLPQNKLVQEKLRHELQAAGIKAGSEVSLDTVKSLVYLDCVVRESLRHSPPIGFSLSRKVTAKEGMEVMGHWVPSGMEIGAQPYSVHRNTEVFSDPESWSPERWELSSGAESFRTLKRHSFPFGAGPRMCIGMSLAIAEMKMLIATVYSTYTTDLALEWFLETGNVRPEEDRGDLWPSENKPWNKRAPLLFRKL